mgnify:CR=1 FL=1
MIKICDYLKVEPETIFEVVDRNNSFLSRKTIKNYHSFLSGVLENAFYDEIIDEKWNKKFEEVIEEVKNM